MTALNTAFLLIKPEACSEAFVRHTVDVLDAAGVCVDEVVTLRSEEVRRGGWVAQHYADEARYANAASAALTSLLHDSATVKSRFYDAFGEHWNSVVARGRLLSARDALVVLGNLSAAELCERWWGFDATHDKRSVAYVSCAPVRLLGGCYVARLEQDDVYVVNGDYPAREEAMCATPSHALCYLCLTWPETSQSWPQLQYDLIGSADPHTARAGSLRHTLRLRYAEFGLAAPPTCARNGLELSSGPLHALASRCVWTARSLHEDAYGRYLLQQGLPYLFVERVLRNPVLQRGSELTTLFDWLAQLPASVVARRLCELFVHLRDADDARVSRLHAAMRRRDGGNDDAEETKSSDNDDKDNDDDTAATMQHSRDDVRQDRSDDAEGDAVRRLCDITVDGALVVYDHEQCGAAPVCLTAGCVDEANARRNRAVVLLKPHAYSERVFRVVHAHLTQQCAGMTVDHVCDVPSAVVREHDLVDRHYGVLAYYALRADAATLPLRAAARGRFARAFGERWRDAVARGRVCNARAARHLLGNVSAMELYERWQAAATTADEDNDDDDTHVNDRTTKRRTRRMRRGGVVRLLSGAYVAWLRTRPSTSAAAMHNNDNDTDCNDNDDSDDDDDDDDDGVYVVNGFYPYMRSSFVAPTATVRCLLVSWPEQQLSWCDFRTRVIGATDPRRAAPCSLRALLLREWRALGLAAAPTTTENGVHASASPLEAAVERQLWCGAALHCDSLARALQRCGASVATLLAWSSNPIVDDDVDKDNNDDTAATKSPRDDSDSDSDDSDSDSDDNAACSREPRRIFDVVENMQTSALLRMMCAHEQRQLARYRAAATNRAVVLLHPHAVTPRSVAHVRDALARAGVDVVAEYRHCAHAAARRLLQTPTMKAVRRLARRRGRALCALLSDDARRALRQHFDVDYDAYVQTVSAARDAAAAAVVGVRAPASNDSRHRDRGGNADDDADDDDNDDDDAEVAEAARRYRVTRVWGAWPYCAHAHVDARTLMQRWSDAQPVRLTHCCYAAYLRDDDAVVVNGFYPYVYASMLYAPARRVHCFDVAWRETTCDWAAFCTRVVGDADVHVAAAGSLQRSVAEQWRELGLCERPCVRAQCAISVAAGPLQAMAARALWALHDDDDHDGNSSDDEYDDDDGDDANGGEDVDDGVAAAAAAAASLTARHARNDDDDDDKMVATTRSIEQQQQRRRRRYGDVVDAAVCVAAAREARAARARRRGRVAALLYGDATLQWLLMEGVPLSLLVHYALGYTYCEGERMRAQDAAMLRHVSTRQQTSACVRHMRAVAAHAQRAARMGYAFVWLCPAQQQQRQQQQQQTQQQRLPWRDTRTDNVSSSHDGDDDNNSRGGGDGSDGRCAWLRRELTDFFAVRHVHVRSSGTMSLAHAAQRSLLDDTHESLYRNAMTRDACAMALTPRQRDAFAAAFGVSWATAVRLSLVLSAAAAVRRYGEARVVRTWAASSTRKLCLSPSLYVAYYAADGVYVVNGFYPYRRARLYGSGASGASEVVWLHVAFDEQQMTWSRFLHDVIGDEHDDVDDGSSSHAMTNNHNDNNSGGDDATSSSSSLRRHLRTHWMRYGFAGPPDALHGLVHVAATPLAALAQRCRWWRMRPEEDVLGRLLCQAGVLPSFLRDVLANPYVHIAGQTLDDVSEAFALLPCSTRALQRTLLEWQHRYDVSLLAADTVFTPTAASLTAAAAAAAAAATTTTTMTSTLACGGAAHAQTFSSGDEDGSNNNNDYNNNTGNAIDDSDEAARQQAMLLHAALARALQPARDYVAILSDPPPPHLFAASATTTASDDDDDDDDDTYVERRVYDACARAAFVHSDNDNDNDDDGRTATGDAAAVATRPRRANAHSGSSSSDDEDDDALAAQSAALARDEANASSSSSSSSHRAYALITTTAAFCCPAATATATTTTTSCVAVEHGALQQQQQQQSCTSSTVAASSSPQPPWSLLHALLRDVLSCYGVEIVYASALPPATAVSRRVFDAHFVDELRYATQPTALHALLDEAAVRRRFTRAFAQPPRRARVYTAQQAAEAFALTPSQLAEVWASCTTVVRVAPHCCIGRCATDEIFIANGYVLDARARFYASTTPHPFVVVAWDARRLRYDALCRHIIGVAPAAASASASSWRAHGVSTTTTRLQTTTAATTWCVHETLHDMLPRSWHALALPGSGPHAYLGAVHVSDSALRAMQQMQLWLSLGVRSDALGSRALTHYLISPYVLRAALGNPRVRAHVTSADTTRAHAHAHGDVAAAATASTTSLLSLHALRDDDDDNNTDNDSDTQRVRRMRACEQLLPTAMPSLSASLSSSSSSALRYLFDVVAGAHARAVLERLLLLEDGHRATAATRNGAVLLLHPAAHCSRMRQCVAHVLAQHHIRIDEEGDVTHMATSAIAKQNDTAHARRRRRALVRCLFDVAAHYAAAPPASVALTSDECARVQAAFGRSWHALLRDGVVVNAYDALTRLTAVDAHDTTTTTTAAAAATTLPLTPQQLYRCWRAARLRVCVRADVHIAAVPRTHDGQLLYVVNGDYPALRESLELDLHKGSTAAAEAAASVVVDGGVHYYFVSWPEQALSWRRFVCDVVGGDDEPAHAAAGSLRGRLYRHWRHYGVRAMPDALHGGVYASTSPLHALALRQRLLPRARRALDEDVLGDALLRAGVRPSLVYAWLRNARVRVDGVTAGVFEHLRGCNTSQLLRCMAAVAAAAPSMPVRSVDSSHSSHSAHATTATASSPPLPAPNFSCLTSAAVTATASSSTAQEADDMSAAAGAHTHRRVHDNSDSDDDDDDVYTTAAAAREGGGNITTSSSSSSRDALACRNVATLVVKPHMAHNAAALQLLCATLERHGVRILCASEQTATTSLVDALHFTEAYYAMHRHLAAALRARRRLCKRRGQHTSSGNDNNNDSNDNNDDNDVILLGDLNIDDERRFARVFGESWPAVLGVTDDGDNNGDNDSKTSLSRVLSACEAMAHYGLSARQLHARVCDAATRRLTVGGAATLCIAQLRLQPSSSREAIYVVNGSYPYVRARMLAASLSPCHCVPSRDNNNNDNDADDDDDDDDDDTAATRSSTLRLLVVAWSSKAMSWRHFVRHVIGDVSCLSAPPPPLPLQSNRNNNNNDSNMNSNAASPHAAAVSSLPLRAALARQWRVLCLPRAPDVADSGVWLSTSPLQACAARRVWYAHATVRTHLPDPLLYTAATYNNTMSTTTSAARAAAASAWPDDDDTTTGGVDVDVLTRWATQNPLLTYDDAAAAALLSPLSHDADESSDDGDKDNDNDNNNKPRHHSSSSSSSDRCCAAPATHTTPRRAFDVFDAVDTPTLLRVVRACEAHVREYGSDDDDHVDLQRTAATHYAHVPAMRRAARHDTSAALRAVVPSARAAAASLSPSSARNDGARWPMTTARSATRRDDTSDNNDNSNRTAPSLSPLRARATAAAVTPTLQETLSRTEERLRAAVVRDALLNARTPDAVRQLWSYYVSLDASAATPQQQQQQQYASSLSSLSAAHKHGNHSATSRPRCSTSATQPRRRCASESGDDNNDDDSNNNNSNGKNYYRNGNNSSSSDKTQRIVPHAACSNASAAAVLRNKHYTTASPATAAAAAALDTAVDVDYRAFRHDFTQLESYGVPIVSGELRKLFAVMSRRGRMRYDEFARALALYQTL